jgi:DNA-3-methyladenine glycosylase
MLDASFFDQDAQHLAVALLGKVLRHHVGGLVLSAMIVETEAYYVAEKGSHSSLGRTPSREPMFLDPGTIYMYYARGGDSLNVGARGPGNAVLIKGAVAFSDGVSGPAALETMHANNPLPSGARRPHHRLCGGQTLVCRALGLKVPDWWGRAFVASQFYIEDVGDDPASVVRAPRLGIPAGRDEHLQFRFIHAAHARASTKNPLTRRNAVADLDYAILPPADAPGPAPG